MPTRRLTRLLPFILGLVCVAGGCTAAPAPSATQPDSGSQAVSGSDEVLARAFEERERDLRVEGQGVVRKVLPDDARGSRHQRFILELGSGQTLLVAHNIDLAPRVAGLREGDEVLFSGEYEWNPEGGVIHWTHRDPRGRRTPGWLKHKGKVYQ